MRRSPELSHWPISIDEDLYKKYTKGGKREGGMKKETEEVWPEVKEAWSGATQTASPRALGGLVG